LIQQRTAPFSVFKQGQSNQQGTRSPSAIGIPQNLPTNAQDY
jgi:hypothetical protein